MAPATEGITHRFITVLLGILIPALLSGCVAAATGAAAGAAASNRGPSSEVKKYVRTHDLEPRIARAIEGGYIVIGMEPEHVRLVLGEPADIEKNENRKIWIYDDSGVGKSRYYFQDGRLVEAPFLEE